MRRPPVEAPKASLKQRAALWASLADAAWKHRMVDLVQRAAAVLLRESWHPSTHAEFMLLQVRAQYTLAESLVADLGAARGRLVRAATADADKAGGGGGGGGSKRESINRKVALMRFEFVEIVERSRLVFIRRQTDVFGAGPKEIIDFVLEEKRFQCVHCSAPSPRAPF